MTGKHSHQARAMRSTLAGGALLFLVCCVALAQAPIGAQGPAQTGRAAAFRAVSYDVYASLAPETQSLSARAIVEFESQDLSRTVECELHPNLRLTAVRDESGKVLEFDRDDRDDIGVRIVLPNPVPAGQRVKLTFEYSGPLANEENSPVSGTRLASINRDSAYLLLPARWFPLTGFPANRFTGVFHIEVPQNFVVAGTGTAAGPGPAQAFTTQVPAANPAETGAPVLAPRNRVPAKKAPAPLSQPAPQPSASAANPVGAAASGRIQYTFRVDRPEAAGTFVAGALQLASVKAEGLNVAVYTVPGSAASAEAYGDAIARIVTTLSDQFGPLPQPNLTIAQLPDGSLPTFAAPGLLLVSQRQWAAMPDTRALSNLVASQWWGQEVMAASPSDAWLTDGLARYAEALYVEQSASREAMNKALEDFAIGSLMYENKSPIAEAGRLVPFSPDYTSVVVNKGALVFHMLREQLGDNAFFALLRDFFKQYDGKTATLANFEKLAQDHADQLNSNASAGSGNFVLRTTTGSDTVTAGTTPAADSPAEPINLRPFFAQWLNSTGVPEFTLDYTVYRTKAGFRIDGKIKQALDFFHMPVELEVQTEGNPEFKTVEVSGTESSFDIEVFGRPKPNGIILDPHNYILKSSPALRVRAIIARGESLAQQGRYYDAVQQYSQALDVQKNDSLALFRTGEAFFYQKNYSAAASSFRDALDGDLDPTTKWVEVWSHIYLGKVYDIAGDRTRAVNEYSKAQQTNDDTGGAQAEAQKYLSKPYTEGT